MAIANTLKYLLLSEFLSPQNLPKKDQTKTKRVSEFELDKLSDEKILNSLRKTKPSDNKIETKDLANPDPKKRKSLFIEIYGGIYETSEIAQKIYEVIGQKSDEFSQNSLEHAASYYIKLGGDAKVLLADCEEPVVLSDLVCDDGKYKDESLKGAKILCGGDSGYGILSAEDDVFVSMAPWACAKFKDKKSELTSENFSKLQSDIYEKINELCSDRCSVKELVSYIHDVIKEALDSPLVTNNLRVCVSVAKKPQCSAMLNSFFIDDISMVLKDGANDEILNIIFDESDEADLKSSRLDVRDASSLKQVISNLACDDYPLGAFASKFSLNFSQQIAVNEILRLFRSGRGGVYSVNGPPGTGKTTLLKDVIAGVIVQRAIALSELEEDKIFDTGVENAKTTSNGKSGDDTDYYPLNSKLKGYEIVVASSNNKAVQNISKELPKQDSICAKLDYFANAATRLLSCGKHISNPAWGLICATMGNSANQKSFKEDCLNPFEIDKSFEGYNKLKERNFIKDNIKDGKKIGEKINGLIDDIIEAEFSDFKAAKRDFNDALTKAGRLWASMRGGRDAVIPKERIARENSSPFLSENGSKSEFALAREEVFLKALELHKAAILSAKNRTKFRTNLYAFCDLYKFGKAIDRVEIIRSLFFIVPVLSSTFASFGRFFEAFGRNEIGILLADESGQANIAAAVGALYRAKTAVIVGDPLQLEPVVTLPASLNDALLRYTGAKDEFNVSRTSLQACADKRQKIGTYIAGTWVGSPLIVHRRCDNPMFDIANEIAYDGAMIWGAGKNVDSLARRDIKSKWYDVKTQGNWIGNCSDEELKAANEIYKELEKIYGADVNNKVKIITPFTDVVKRSELMKNLKDNDKDKIEFSAATIHTMQGQEACVVIFILGGGSAGARDWAASKPNLLNVALTRAKEYIFIVGDKDEWSKLNYFKTAAAKLPSE